jgi:hypothetical protein
MTMATMTLDTLPRPAKLFRPQIGYGVAMSKEDRPHDDRHDSAFGERISNGLAAKATILPQSQIQEIADAAASKAIRAMWVQFGVDLGDADSVRAINEDFIELRRQRKARERWAWMIKGALLTGLVSVIGLILSYIWKLLTADLHLPHSP